VENYKKVDELFGKAILHRRDKKRHADAGKIYLIYYSTKFRGFGRTRLGSFLYGRKRSESKALITQQR